MALNLTDFLAELRHHGTHPHNRFTVTITPPAGLDFNERTLSLRAANAMIPGRNVMTKNDSLRYGHGVVEKIGYGTLFGDLPVGFIVDNQFDLPKVFDDWMKLINPANSSDTNRDTRYLAAYKDDYATTITVSVYNSKNNKTAVYTFNEAFPTVTQDITLGWDGVNTITILPVVFTYTDFTLR